MVEFPPSFLPLSRPFTRNARFSPFLSLPFHLSVSLFISFADVGSRWATADRNLSNVFVRSRVQISITCQTIRSTLQTFPLFNADTNRLFFVAVACGMQFCYLVDDTFRLFEFFSRMHQPLIDSSLENFYLDKGTLNVRFLLSFAKDRNFQTKREKVQIPRIHARRFLISARSK